MLLQISLGLNTVKIIWNTVNTQLIKTTFRCFNAEMLHIIPLNTFRSIKHTLIHQLIIRITGGPIGY